MRAVVTDGYGGPEVLRVADVEDPVPGPGEVLLDVAATASANLGCSPSPIVHAAESPA